MYALRRQGIFLANTRLVRIMSNVRHWHSACLLQAISVTFSQYTIVFTNLIPLHFFDRLKSCEPEFLLSTPKRLLELVSLKEVDISGVSLLVILNIFSI